MAGLGIPLPFSTTRKPDAQPEGLNNLNIFGTQKDYGYGGYGPARPSIWILYGPTSARIIDIVSEFLEKMWFDKRCN